MANNFLTGTELDFNALRAQLKTYLSSQDRFKDYDFDGSNMSVLIDLLAYNTYLEAHYLNMVGSESFLDTTRLLDSAYSHAKELNYVPRSVTSARAVVTLSVDTNGTNPQSVTVPKYFGFTSAYLDAAGIRRTYTFSTLEPLTIRMNDNGQYVASNVTIHEGRVVREVYTANSTARYVLQSPKADTSTLTVIVQESNVNTSNTEFTLAENLYGLDGTDAVYFLQGAYDGRHEVRFGDGTIGRALKPGNLVRLTYLSSTGSDANGANTFSPAATFDGYTVSSVLTEVRAYGGAPKEDVDSIKFNAPRHFTTQERAVTTTDFINLIRAKFPQLQDVIAYGGEKVVPKQYGRVIISVKPYGDTVISDSLKNDIISYIRGKNVVTEPVIVDAEYLFINVAVNVRYDKGSTTSTKEAIRAAVHQTVSEFFEDELDGFGVSLRYSRLLRSIDDADPSIVGNNVDIRLMKRLYPQEGVSNGIAFSFMNRLKVQTRNSDREYHDPIVQSTNFTHMHNDELYDCAVQDDGAGVLFIYTKNGDDKIFLEEIGTVNYETGEVAVNLVPFSYDTSIDFIAIPERDDVSVEANVFLSLNEEALTVEVEAE